MAGVPSIDEVWRRISAHQGEQFETKTGLPLTYSVDGNLLTTDRSEYPLGIGDFEKVLETVPLDTLTGITHLVRGPSYIWAILHDPRIRKSDW